jgi:iron(III) transport system permease protein
MIAKTEYHGRFRWRVALDYGVLAIVGFLVLSPILLLVIDSFNASTPGKPFSFSLFAWKVALSGSGIRSALWNTVALVAVRQSISFLIAVVLAWAVARTDLPGRRWLEFLFLLAFFLPTIPVVVAWILLLDPDYGIINTAVTKLPFVREPPFDIYSFAGIIWVHLTHTAVATKVVLLVPLFRAMDASLEEASRLFGASAFGTLWRITVPILMPGLITVFLIGAIATMQSFEIEQILGPPIRFSIFSTELFRLIHRDPPNYAAAAALSSFVLVVMLPIIIAQRWLTSRVGGKTVGSRYRGTVTALGRWRWPAFMLALSFALLTTVVPIVILLVFSFARKWGYYNIEHAWTTENWLHVFADRTFLESLRNSLQLGFGTAIGAVVGFTAMAYIIARSRFELRAALDAVTWLPSVLPGIILSLGLLDLFLSVPFLRVFYNTKLSLVLAVLLTAMTLGVHVIKNALLQLRPELEETARVIGATEWITFRSVVAPLAMPSILLCATLAFAIALRDVSSIVFLGSAETRPLSLLQLDYMMEGWYEPACVVGLILAGLTAAAAGPVALLAARFDAWRR